MTPRVRRILGGLLLIASAAMLLGGNGVPGIIGPGPGPRTMLLFHETEQQGVKMNALTTTLRSGEAGKYIEEKQHQLFILDDDAKDENEQPSAIVEKWRPVFKDLQLPAVIVTPKGSDTVLLKQSIPEDTSASKAIELLKSTGG